MPRACPACGRPNSQQAARCLYCAALLDPSEPEAASNDEAASPLEPSSRHLIILAPQAAARDETVERFAALTGGTSYDARLALQTRRYRLLRRVETADEAKRASRALSEAGVEHQVIQEADIEALPVMPVPGVRLGKRHIELVPADGALLSLANEDLVLVVRGQIVRERHRERQMGTLRGASQPMTPGWRLHLYGAGATVAAEIDPEHFDWTLMGDARSDSTAINLRWLVEQILARSTGSRLDLGFDWEPAVVSRAQTDSDLDTLLSGDPRGREGVVQDNLSQFRFYARWRFLVEGERRRATGGEHATTSLPQQPHEKERGR